eukprot:708013_1
MMMHLLLNFQLRKDRVKVKVMFKVVHIRMKAMKLIFSIELFNYYSKMKGKQSIDSFIHSYEYSFQSINKSIHQLEIIYFKKSCLEIDFEIRKQKERKIVIQTERNIE